MAGHSKKIPLDELIRMVLEDEYEFTEEDVRHHLYKARAVSLLQIEKDLGGDVIVNKDRTAVFNSLQCACERHELAHKNIQKNPLEDMINPWREAMNTGADDAAEA